tara:strand:- start:8703 stop:9353 length:651 start_codon:yes stop_codon:yes gene_type:complete
MSLNTKDLLIERKGIYGFGFSSNSELDLMNLVVLAVAGIIVKIFFEENFTKLGSSGPASTTIWGYGLTAISLILMTFMGLYLTNNHKGLFEGDGDVFSYFMSILTSDAVPVMFTLGIVLYIISLNFIYFKRINSNKVSSSYSTYSFFSSLLIIIQIGIIIKYMFSILKTIKNNRTTDPERNKEQAILKGASIIATSVNFIFILILHILLAFFSTDG